MGHEQKIGKCHDHRPTCYVLPASSFSYVEVPRILRKWISRAYTAVFHSFQDKGAVTETQESYTPEHLFSPFDFSWTLSPPLVGSRTLYHLRIVRDFTAVVPHHRIINQAHELHNFFVRMRQHTVVPALHLSDALCLTERWKLNPRKSSSRGSRFSREHSSPGSEFFC